MLAGAILVQLWTVSCRTALATRDTILHTLLGYKVATIDDYTATTRTLASPSWSKAKDRAQDDLKWRQKRKGRLPVDVFDLLFSRLFCLTWSILVHQMAVYPP
jgi:hypothetical protein